MHFSRNLLAAVAGVVLLAGTVRGDTFNVNTAQQFFDALQEIADNPGRDDTINITGGFTMNQPVPSIAKNGGFSLTVNGNNNTIDGGGQYRPFFVDEGAVAINDLAVQNGMAQGGDGSGGGLGAGGAVFVDAGANVTLNNVDFDDNDAAGGDGRAVASGGGGAGGDGGLEGGGGGGLYGDGGDGGNDGGLAAESGGGGGGEIGNGGNAPPGGNGGGGGGGGRYADGGDGDSSGVDAGGGGGGGGKTIDGADAAGNTGSVNNPASEGGDGGNDGAGGQAGAATGGGGGGGADGNGGAGGQYGGGGGAGDNALGSGGAGGRFGGGGGGSDDANGGNGGEFGGGGGNAIDAGVGNGGNGGFGGGGGSGNVGGNGGFGAGGGAGASTPGNGGFGAGNGAADGGGGGAAFGGAVFVRSGGTLTITGNSTSSGGSLSAGSGAGSAGIGTAAGSGLYLQGGGVTFNIGDGDTSSFNNDIADADDNGQAGAVVKSGVGTLNLNGNNSYAGNTTVNAGTLNLGGTLSDSNTTVNNGGTFNLNTGGSAAQDITVSAGGTLGGIGSAENVTVSGTIAPGNSIGTLTVNQDYVQNAGSTYEVEIDDAGNSDLIDVTGTATLNGGTVDVQAAAGTYSVGQLYTILTAGGGVDGEFAGTTDDLDFFNAVLEHNANNVQLRLVLSAAGFDGVVRTFNQRAVANNLVQQNNPTGELADVINSFQNLNNSQIRAALDAISGEIYGSATTVGVEANSGRLRRMANRLRGLGGPGGFYMDGARVLASQTPAGKQNPDIALAGYTEEFPLNEIDESCIGCGDTLDACGCGYFYNAWVEGWGAGGNIQDDGNAASVNYGFSGTAFGLDHWVDPEWVVGLGGAVTYSDIRAASVASTGNVDGYHLSLYTRKTWGNHYLIAIGGLGYHDYDVTRRIAVDTVDVTATGDYFGYEFDLFFEKGWNWRWGETHFQPFIGVQYIALTHNGFTESGAGGLNLTTRRQDFDSLRGTFGARLARQYYYHGRLWTPEFRAQYVQEFLDDGQSVFSTFAGGNNVAFGVEGVKLGREHAVFGLGLTGQLSDRTKIYGNYDLQTSRGHIANTGSAGLEVRW